LNDFIAYGQSKLANILHPNELSRIFKVSLGCLTLNGSRELANSTRSHLHEQEEGVNISANAVHLVSSPLTFSGQDYCRWYFPEI
jgi:hypothetical protein